MDEVRSKMSTDTTTDTAEDTPIATWKAAFAPGWAWEAFEVEARNAEVVLGLNADGEPTTAVTTIYFGRVRSPLTHDRWEYGSFTARDLRTAGAFRTDEDTDEWP